jgi:hypothetical protein
MSLPTIDYNDVVAQTEGIAGSAFTASELPRIKALINMGARHIYRASNFWERYLQFAKNVPVWLGAIYRTAPEDGDLSPFLPDGLYLQPDSGFVYVAPDTEFIYAEIDTLMHVSAHDPKKSGIIYTLPFASTGIGYELIGNNKNLTEAWITYKSKLTGKFGDGVGENADVPEEWADYISYYVARQYQIGSRQPNSNPMVTIAMREVEEHLQDALMKLEGQNYAEHIGKYIQTNLMFDRSL